MRSAPVLLAVLLVACSLPPAEDLTAALIADPCRLKTLRTQCEADRQATGEDVCRAAAEAFRLRFFFGDTGPDEYNTLKEVPPIPPSFDMLLSEEGDGDEVDVAEPETTP